MLAIIFSVCLVFSFIPLSASASSNQSASTSLLEQEDSGDNVTVKAGVFAFDGYHMKDVEGNFYGYGIEVLDMISRYSHLNFDLVAFDSSWHDMLDMLQNGEIDVVTSASKTPDREALFDFSLPIGRKSTVLSVTVDNDKFATGIYDTYNGMVVGEIEGNTQNKIFDEFANEHDFTYSKKMFSDDATLATALQNGDVDAIVTSDLRKRNNEKTLEIVEENDFYAIVRKGETELLDEINRAIEKMDIAEGDWRNVLHYEFYGLTYSNALDFTAGEEDYIEQVQRGEKKIVATAFPDLRPYAYDQDGKLTGVLIDYFSTLMQQANLPYELIIPSSLEEYRSLIDNEQVNVVLDNIDGTSFSGNTFAKSFKTTAFMETNTVQVTKDGFNGTISSIAIPVSPGSVEMAGAADEQSSTYDIKYYPNREAALQAVVNGDVDAAYVYVYTAQEFINRLPDSELSYKVVYGMDVEFSISVTANADHELVNVLDKLVKRNPSSTINELVNKYTAYDLDELTIWQYLKANPYLVAAAIMFFLFIAAVVAMLIIKWRMSEKVRSSAQKANEAKTTFLNSVSHDIRTPMNSIIGFTSLASAHIDDQEKVEEYLENIKISSDHLLRLINDVLDMSRIESGKVKINTAPASISDIMSSLETIVRADVDAKELAFSLDMNDVADDVVACDKLRLNQVLLNIISNAVKYTEVGGSVSVKVYESNPVEVAEQKAAESDNEKQSGVNENVTRKARYSFAVSDTGIGMSEEFLEHVFDPFEREDSATVSGIQGTGLGLAITKNLVELMGGEISVESELGVGSTFTASFEFEIMDKETLGDNINKKKSDVIKDTFANAKDALAGKKILMAEDNALSRQIAVTILEDVGVIVDAVEDGKYAVEKLKENPAGTYDVVLTDVQMPIMNGYETAKAIRSLDDPDKASIPIIAVTANVFEEDQETAREAGVDGYIPKPIEIDKLFEAIESLSQK